MYDRIIARVTRTPWALQPEKLGEIADLLRFRANGGRLTAEEIKARIGDAPDSPSPSRVERTIAVIPVFGVITHRANSFESFSGGTSTEMLGKYIRRAAADESVKSIILDVSSPGGTVDGLPELAAEIVAAKKMKPVVAHANALAASSAYWLASQATEFVVTPSGRVGSIGVYLLTEDLSEHLAKEGIKINAISAGDHKLDGAPWEPMSAETRAFLQKQVDAVYGDFVKAVAAGRRVTQATVKETFGQGRVFHSDEALKLGMVDAVETFDETVARLMKKGMRSTGRAMADAITIPIAATAEAAAAAAEAFGSAFPVADDVAPGAQAAADEATTTSADDRDELTAAAEAVTSDVAASAEAERLAAAQRAADADYIATGLRIAERQ